ncbi:uncharacterized protein LOC107844148 [Capsicum annuum]|uniref:uncharacterized protein LOC107844148 n=1 Tax=Capsicum annuum TaxID=4072 RepID=UPI001FB17FB6|nr:uncharacterized protein LOC107844148 [Capsicum annuum]
MKKTDENQFLYVFIALRAFIKGFDHCRPVVVVNGSHLRGMYTGTFVTACTMDGAVDIRVKKYLELTGYDKWVRSYATIHRGWTMTLNIAESINEVLVSARELSVYDFLEEVRLLMYQPQNMCTQCSTNKSTSSFASRKEHAHSKTGLRTYNVSIYPLPYKDDWIISTSILGEIVLLPKCKRPPGRPAKKDRGKSRRYMFGKKNINSCSGCEAKGHNRRSCRKCRK